VWGIFGEEISWCTVKRLGFQTLLPLMASAAVAAFAGRTDNLFFCNANVYRSTGTVERSTIAADYVRNMMLEDLVVYK